MFCNPPSLADTHDMLQAAFNRFPICFTTFSWWLVFHDLIVAPPAPDH
jgi:hypothetical protein